MSPKRLIAFFDFEHVGFNRDKIEYVGAERTIGCPLRAHASGIAAGNSTKKPDQAEGSSRRIQLKASELGTAVDVDGFAHDPARLIGGKERDDTGNVTWLAKAL
jgi:hypothetical protein